MTRDTELSLARVLLKAEGEKGPITPEIIDEKVRMVLLMTGGVDDARVSELSAELQTVFNVWIGEGLVLEDNNDHQPWLPDHRADIAWKFWGRYIQYLEEDAHLPPQTLARLDSLTEAVLERLEQPQRAGRWDRRGMVVGHVQSGKTANYTGLICKAIDAGYKLVIVLAGLHNSLRSQTQLRLDEGILGFDTRDQRTYNESNKRIGVGKTGPRLIANSFTHSGEDGDFNTRVANQAAVHFGGGDPFLLVVKKNHTVLGNLIRWALGLRGEKNEKGDNCVKNVSLLVIDDEADNASIDVQSKKKDAASVSKINGLIRQLLNVFEQSAYVAYTATPFANIFIDPAATNAFVGDDLFPRDFIINLPAPSNYVGPAMVFGLTEDVQAGVEGQEGLPIVRSIDDQDSWMPVRHKVNHVPGPLPLSLKEALCAFVLSCAVRILRGQLDRHNSMLVHVTRFTKVQAAVKDLVEQEIVTMRRRLEFGEGRATSTLVERMRDLWEADFVPSSRAMGADVPSWADVEGVLHKACARIQVRAVNGTAQDVLDYRDYKQGLSVIAIGGDKLSRGLTLEGLSVSYYLRASKMYDTLMQMGRWFGYRPGYLDVCRLYTSPELQEWYRHISLASEELRREFDFMVTIGRTPTEFGLRVRTHPDALMVTAANKMRSGTKLRISFARSVSESIVFHRDQTIRVRNLEALKGLVDAMSLQGGRQQRSHFHLKQPQWVWTQVPASTVMDFLSGYTSHPDSPKANAVCLRDYVARMQQVQELTEWTVVLLSNSKAPELDRVDVAGCAVGLVVRKEKRSETDPDRVAIGRLVSPRDECLDLDPVEFESALDLSRKIAEEKRALTKVDFPSGVAIRTVRPSTRGLLLVYVIEHEVVPLVGIGLSFPDSSNAQTVEYVVNNPYFDQEYLEA